jgi:hypothetical protein
MKLKPIHISLLIVTLSAGTAYIAYAQTGGATPVAVDSTEALEPARIAHGKARLGHLKTARIVSENHFFREDGSLVVTNKQVRLFDFKKRMYRSEEWIGNKQISSVSISPNGGKAWGMNVPPIIIEPAQIQQQLLFTVLGPFALRTDASEVKRANRKGNANLNVNAGTSVSVADDDSSTTASAVGQNGTPASPSSPNSISSGSTPSTSASTDGQTARSTVSVSGEMLEMQVETGEKLEMAVNPTTDLLAMQKFITLDGLEQVAEFSDYQLVDGLKVPFQTRVFQAGKLQTVEKVLVVELNIPLNNKDFNLQK